MYLCISSATHYKKTQNLCGLFGGKFFVSILTD